MTRALAALFSLLLLVGCGTDTDDNEPETDTGTSQNETPAPETEEPTPDASGELITGTGYTFNAPDGWGVPEQQTPGFDPDSLAANLDDDDDFVDNVNVLLSPAGEVTPDQVEDMGVQELEAVGATDIEVNDRTTVAGNESAHLSATMSMGEREYVVDQFYASNAGQTYVVTFSFSPSISDGERSEAVESALSTWTWTN